MKKKQFEIKNHATYKRLSKGWALDFQEQLFKLTESLGFADFDNQMVRGIKKYFAMTEDELKNGDFYKLDRFF